MIIIVRLRYNQSTNDYLQRRLADRKTKREAIRCLKRYLAREIFRTITTDLKKIHSNPLTIYRNVPGLNISFKSTRPGTLARTTRTSRPFVGPRWSCGGWQRLIPYGSPAHP